ncbi:hypothetical protein [Virgibacillus alimentarius]|uniref:Uncharacterized protein n=1 Tax=Virgibacillus alimentarius TaxID=698769 RepID=A0ABS4S4D2_9BACI|nr:MULTISPECIES: hypothetical protein [Virgibacillus]MBP2256346.1 hypothetical protein [Virgibacillus alimentarius]HLR66291.1 hypothetical protein [Virgibacillus sp.]
MTFAVNENDQMQNGVPKTEFEKSLQHISEQVRLMDQQLTIKVENNILLHFQHQQNEIHFIEMMVERMKGGPSYT